MKSNLHSSLHKLSFLVALGMVVPAPLLTKSAAPMGRTVAKSMPAPVVRADVDDRASCIRPGMECCSELIADFNGTFTVLSEILTVVNEIDEDVDFIISRVLDLDEDIDAGFNGTFTLLANLLACPCEAAGCDLSGVFTALVDIKVELVAGFNGTFTVLEEIESDLDFIISRVIDIDADIDAGFNGTFTLLANLLACPCEGSACDLSGVFTALRDIKVELVEEFNGTFTVLREVTCQLGDIDGDVDLVFNVVNENNTLLKQIICMLSIIGGEPVACCGPNFPC